MTRKKAGGTRRGKQSTNLMVAASKELGSARAEEDSGGILVMEEHANPEGVLRGPGTLTVRTETTTTSLRVAEAPGSRSSKGPAQEE